jgi:Rhs element Vgr protein
LYNAFDGQTRYFQEINDSPVKPDVLRFRGREALSEPFRRDIEFTTPKGNLVPEDVLMKYASFRMRSGKNVHGIVTRLEWLSTIADQSHYRLTLSSRLALLEHTRQCRVFQNRSVPEVVEQVLRCHGLEGPDFEFRLERTYPPHEIITQWRETDLQFIRRILSEVGIYWRTEMDNSRELDTYIFADSQLHYRFDVRLPYREPSGLFDGAAESVWDVRTWHKVVTGTVATRDYNYRTATTPMDATARVHLFSNASGLTPGQVLEPQGDVITALKEGVLLTLVTFRGARDSRLHVSVWGMPYTERWCFRPTEIPRPEIHGTLPARVESREKNDIYAHLDGHGRYPSLHAEEWHKTTLQRKYSKGGYPNLMRYKGKSPAFGDKDVFTDIASFSGNITARSAREMAGSTIFRAFGNPTDLAPNGSLAAGGFWGYQKVPGSAEEWRQLSAVLDEWNGNGFLVVLHLPEDLATRMPGSNAWHGKIAEQFGSAIPAQYLKGGGEQVIINLDEMLKKELNNVGDQVKASGLATSVEINGVKAEFYPTNWQDANGVHGYSKPEGIDPPYATTTRELHDDELRSKVKERAMINAARIEHQTTTGNEQ